MSARKYTLAHVRFEWFMLTARNELAVGKDAQKKNNYRKISNIRRTKSKNLNVSRLLLQLYLCDILKPVVKSRMKM